MVNAARHYAIIHPGEDGQNKETSSLSEEEHSNATESSSEDKTPRRSQTEAKETNPITSTDNRNLKR